MLFFTSPSIQRTLRVLSKTICALLNTLLLFLFLFVNASFSTLTSPSKCPLIVIMYDMCQTTARIDAHTCVNPTETQKTACQLAGHPSQQQEVKTH
ncbi:hypothetical protein PsorP6_016791 [Peronosclerospora sorghi]|uniref:Uncharacterized protein n=1 Tax=Peronosclerospora sorghi TaxID=230839 RepID=A0ACC0WEZ9_9STRA|nr:hypothetical protein PsorP6_016791 [Peronosclerospora sorghi]